MSYTTDAADLVVRIGIESSRAALRIVGKGARGAASLLYRAIKEEREKEGSKRLDRMLEDGKEIRMFSVSDEDMTRFIPEARRLGLRYVVLAQEDRMKETVNLLAEEREADKISRVLEAIGASGQEPEEILPKKEEEKKPDQVLPKLNMETFLSKAVEEQKAVRENPTLGRAGGGSRYGPSLRSSRPWEKNRKPGKNERISVREELGKLVKEEEQRRAWERDREKELAKLMESVLGRNR